MKKFLIKLLIFSSITAVFIISYIFLFTGNDVDSFYERFTVKKQSSLILGSSRAAQAIEPEVLIRKLKLKNGIYNYAFTLSPAKWGPPYLKSIKKKLIENNKTDNIFILECNPWSFYSKPDNIGEFPEKNSIPNSIIWPNMNPNLEYFFGGLQYPNMHLIASKLICDKEPTFVNEFGRLVINLKYDSLNILKKMKNKLKIYESKYRNEVIDSTRFFYLNETVNFLSKKGKVYLVRLPISNQMLSLEEKLISDFDGKMDDVQNANYINLKSLSNDLITTDGNHLHNKFTGTITNILADSIKNDQL